MSAVEDLVDYIFDSDQSALYFEFAEWVQASRRFKDFASTYRSKIRSKLRNVRDAEALNDVRAELETAARLLTEKQFALEYESYTAAKQRGPDFTVTYKTHTPFNVEVRRMRSVEPGTVDSDMLVDKLIAIVCEKVRQMPPSIVNVLWLITGNEISEPELSAAMLVLRQHAESKDETFFSKRRFESASAFLRQYQQLSGIMLPQSGENVIWTNPLARHKLLPGLISSLQRI